MKRMIVDRQIVKNNLAVVRKRADGAELYAVLKYNAYGLGLREMAKLLRENGVSRFAVTEPEEAKVLRDSGFVEEEILMLRSTADRNELETLLDLNVICTIGSNDAAVALNGIAEQRGTVASVHLKLDTGAGGYGMLPSEKDKIVAVYRYMANIAVVGIYTDLLYGSNKQWENQMQLFDDTIKYITVAGFDVGIVHTCCSRALMKFGPRDIDGFCVGSALFRSVREREATSLRNAAWAECSVDEIRWVSKGYSLDGKRKAKHAMRVAVLPIGRYHGCFSEEKQGLFRRRKFSVRLNGIRVSVIGYPAMQYTIVDVTGVNCVAGDIMQIPLDPIFAKDLPVTYV